MANTMFDCGVGVLILIIAHNPESRTRVGLRAVVCFFPFTELGGLKYQYYSLV